MEKQAIHTGFQATHGPEISFVSYICIEDVLDKAAKGFNTAIIFIPHFLVQLTVYCWGCCAACTISVDVAGSGRFITSVSIIRAQHDHHQQKKSTRQGDLTLA